MKSFAPILCLLAASFLHAQTEADPFKTQTDAPAEPRWEGPQQVSCCFEVFKLDQKSAAEQLAQRTPDIEFYESLVKQATGGTLQREVLMIVRARSGEKATAKSASDFIFPTEYDAIVNRPPQDPSASADSPEATSLSLALPSGSENPILKPCAFETRELGLTAEISPNLGMNGEIIDLSVNLERVLHHGNQAYGNGLARVEMPIFDRQEIRTALTCRVNRPLLIGSFNPSSHTPNPDSPSEVWLVFMTATLSRP
ncbi:hypothetical protein HNR46_001442 [Haloferula luteola]|uniref:Uncharacterized protein n=1 Tax=Haloferula luteola TaxID=595692 RepID=A0A840V918_9BACT|nr:hypothetical protein [Haloferula luteola]MBB5351208.1 hypothetical protein [Haloferula luteola]